MSLATRLSLIATGAFALATTNLFAGPEPIVDVGKDKNVVQQAEPECNWYVSVGGGFDADYGGTDFVREHNIPSQFGIATLHVPSTSWNDAFDTPYRIEAEVGYALGQHVELFGRFSYDAADGQSTDAYLHIARVGLELENKWDDYRSYGGEVGLRYLFLSRDHCIRPYISLSGGATRVDSIGVTVRAANNVGNIHTGDVLFDGAFYGDSTVATGTVLAGLEVRIARCFSIGADAGLRYQSRLTDDDNDLSRATLAGTVFPNLDKVNNNAGDRLYCPVTFYAKIRF